MEIVMLLLITAGFSMACWDVLSGDIEKIRRKARHKVLALKETTAETFDNDDQVTAHLRMLLKITLGMGTKQGINLFYAVSGICGSLSMILLGKISAGLLIMCVIVFTLIPYALLRIKLQTIRVASSREGEILITELTDNYKINYMNMQHAVEVTAKTIENAPNSKRILFNLSRGLNTAGSTNQIRYVIEEFRLSISTTWGNILATNMLLALSLGIDVSEALDDLSIAITRARKLDEYSARENNESRLVLRYLIPATYLLTIVAAIFMFGLAPDKFIFYQFETEAGLSWITISSILYLVSLGASLFLGKGKLDF